jgi:hypothetical protein
MDTTTTERLKQTVGTTKVIGNDKYGPARLVGGVTGVKDDLSSKVEVQAASSDISCRRGLR